MAIPERLRQPGPTRQMLLVGLTVLGLSVVLATLYLTLVRKPYSVLFNDLRTMDAATIVAELDKRKTPYRLADGGRTILVPAAQVDATRLQVMSQELPLKGTVGFELFNKSDMGLTEFAQKINYRRALEGELARTIMALDGVESARVHLALAEPTLFRDDRQPSKASVTLIARKGWSLPASLVRGVQRLVAAAAPDLALSDVVVLDEHGEIVSEADLPADFAGPPAVQAQSAIEQYYAARIRQALQRYFSEDQLRVEVSAQPVIEAPRAGEAAADPFGLWTPATRSFPLRVSVQVTAPIGPEVRDQVLASVRDAIGGASRGGDAIGVGVVAASASADSGAPPMPVQSAEPSQPSAWPTDSPRTFALAVSGVLLVLLLLAAGILQLRLVRKGRGAGEARRDRYVARLNALLNQEGVDAQAGS